MRSLPDVLFLSFLCVFCLSTPMLFAQESVPCETDEDCSDDVFCNGWEYCEAGGCVSVSACPPSIEGCLVRGAYCDEEFDQCVDEVDDSLCAEEEFCSPFGECVAPGQDVGTSACGLVQSAAQTAVDFGGPYRNHGQMVRTAARTVSEFVGAGVITEECSSCIVSQFARRIPSDEQEPCGLCPVNIRSIYPAPPEVTYSWFDCRAPQQVFLGVGFSEGETRGLIYNSGRSCRGLPGPGICYRFVGLGGAIAVGLSAEEMRACDQALRVYSQELEDLGILEVRNSSSVDSCPLVEP
jgi:hypothetical protein